MSDLRLHRRRHRLGGRRASRAGSAEISDVTVLALEAGGEPYPENVTNPALWYTLFGTPIDWGYLSVPQKALGGRPTYEPRGKMPGGSSNLYIMMHIRGHRSDYDNWAYNGCPGWSYDECLAYFQKLEDQEDDTNPTGGKGGPIHVSNAGQHDPNPTSQAFLDACAELGFPSTDDFNGPQHGGRRLAPHQRQGRQALLDEGGLPRPGLVPREPDASATHSQATRLILENGKCVGVEYVKDGEQQRGARDARGDRLRRRDRVAAPAAAAPASARRSTCGRTAIDVKARAAGRRRELPQPRAHRRDPRGQAAGADRASRTSREVGALLQVRPGAGRRPTCRSRSCTCRSTSSSGRRTRTRSRSCRASCGRSRAATSGSRAPTRS